MSTTVSKTELLIVSEHELVKQYQELDPQNRPWKLYTAPVHAINGAPCLVSELVYVNTTSTNILAKKEGYSTWNTSWVDGMFSAVPNPLLLYSKTELIRVHENELTKHYHEYDGQNRVFRLYETPVWATTGDPCKVVEYLYQNPTSTVILGMKEGYTLWDAAWVPDSAFTVGV